MNLITHVMGSQTQLYYDSYIFWPITDYRHASYDV